MPILARNAFGLLNTAAQVAGQGTFQVPPGDRGVGAKQNAVGKTFLPSNSHKLLKMAVRHK